MTTKTTALAVVAQLDPNLAAILSDVNALPAGMRVDVEEELTATEEAYSALVADVPLWTLKDASGIWVRASDASAALSVNAATLSERITEAEDTGELGHSSVRRGVRSTDVSIFGQTDNCLTDSPRGVMMLSLDALTLLAMRSSGSRGIDLRRRVKAVLDAFPRVQRLCTRLLLERLATPTARTFEQERELKLLDLRIVEASRDRPTRKRIGSGRRPLDTSGVAAFVADRCEAADGAEVSTSYLYAAYLAWHRHRPDRPVAKNIFGEALRALGFAPGRGGDTQRIRHGLRLVSA